MGGVEYQVTKVDPTDPETKGMVHQVHKVSEEIAATIGGKVYRARIINDPTAPTVAGKVYQIVLIDDPDDPSVKGMVYNAILTGGSEAVIVGPAVSPLSLPDAVAGDLDYVKAFGGTEQRNLPDGYIQRQFIYMMDGSYIWTDIVPESGGKVEMDFQTTTTAAQVASYLGAREPDSSVGNGLRLTHGTTATRLIIIYGFEEGGDYQASVGFSNDTRYKFTYDNGVATVYSGSTLVASHTFTPNSTCTTPLVINGTATSSVGGNIEGIYLYSFRVWNTQGNLVADYVPAVQVGTVPVVGFYDMVSKTFKTATAGTFAAGPEAVSTPDVPMDIVSNNGALRSIDNDLPSDCTRLQYITLSGNSYFDSGIVPNTYDYNIETKAAFDVITGGPNCAWGYLGSGNLPRWMLGTYTSGYLINANTTAAVSGADTNEHIFNAVVYDNNGVPYWQSYIDGSQRQDNALASTETWEANTLPIYIGARNNNGTAGSFAEVKIYYHKVTKGDTVIQHLIPCKKADDTLAFYDIVTGAFFTNQGSGTFVEGPVDYSHTHIGVVGTVETISVHSKNLWNPDPTSYEYFDVTASSTKRYGHTYRNGTYTVKQNGTGGAATIYLKVFSNGSYGTAQNITTARTATVSGDDVLLVYSSSGTATDTTDYDIQVERGANATVYQPYYDGGTATAEMLLKVGNYTDEQEILSGVVTRNVGVKVLNGTEEDWVKTNNSFANIALFADKKREKSLLLSSHFQYNTGTTSTIPDGCVGCASTSTNIYFRNDALSTVEDWKQWLASQYAAGTPVIIVYPLATPTTETVTGQTLQVQDGDNTLEITQASLTGLELEAEYEKEVE